MDPLDMTPTGKVKLQNGRCLDCGIIIDSKYDYCPECAKNHDKHTVPYRDFIYNKNRCEAAHNKEIKNAIKENAAKKAKQRCSVDMCENDVFCKGMCQKHYKRAKRNGTAEKTKHKCLNANCKSKDKSVFEHGLCYDCYEIYKYGVEKSSRTIYMDPENWNGSYLDEGQELDYKYYHKVVFPITDATLNAQKKRVIRSRAVRKAKECKGCGLEKTIAAKGLCYGCYQAQRRAKKKEQTT